MEIGLYSFAENTPDPLNGNHLQTPAERLRDLLEEIEEEIREIIPSSTIFTHLEPLEDPLSFEDTDLERQRGNRSEAG